MGTPADITLREIATTENTDDPIFEVRLEGRSYVKFGFFEDVDGVRVFNIESAQNGDMKRMIDFIVEHFGNTTVEFFNVINSTLLDKVHNPSVERKMVDTHRGPQEVYIIRTKWETGA